MNQPASNGIELPYKPPRIAYKTLKNYLDTFKSVEDIPSHIERSVMPAKMSGGNQVAVINALKFFGWISEEGVPQPTFYKLVAAEPKEKQEVLRDAITSAYSFLLDHVDIERTTSRLVIERFKEAGLSGDTIRKSIQFFQGAAKDVGMKISPHIKASQSRPKTQRARKNTGTPDLELIEDDDVDSDVPYFIQKSPYEVLIEILSPDMQEDEQQAVWTLIRYLKKREQEENEG